MHSTWPSRAVVMTLYLSMSFALAGCGSSSSAGLSTGTPSSDASTVPPPSSTAEDVTVIAATPGTATAPPASRAGVAPDSAAPPTEASEPPLTSPPSTTARPGAGAGAGGAYGYVTAGPVCPVERADQPCPPRPVVARIEAQDASGHTVGATDSDSSGYYLLALSPGRYTLTATTGTTYPRCQPIELTVSADTSTLVDISCDTGIR
jgi:hypothetical protein